MYNELTPTGRKSIIAGARNTLGLTINPSEILEFLHDHDKNTIIPRDSHFTGIQIEDHGADSFINLHFESITNPLVHCISLKPNHLLNLLKQHSNGMIPNDAEFDSFAISTNFKTLILLGLKTDKASKGLTEDKLPLAHMRYQGGIMKLYPPQHALMDDKDRNIIITDQRLGI